MSGKNTSVFGIYPDRPSAEEAVDNLCAAGFRHADVSILYQDNQGTKDFAVEKNTKAPEGAVIGGIIGAVIGAVLGWLVGSGRLAIPVLDALSAAGPVVAALAGLGAVGVVGAIIGALAGLGVPEYEAKRFAGRIKGGDTLLSVHCDNRDWVGRAKQLMRDTGAEGIGSEGESRADFSATDKPMLRKRKTTVAEPRPETAEAPLKSADGVNLVRHEPPRS